MKKQKKITLHVTDEEMANISHYFQTKYPWICKENTIYDADLIPVWKIKIGEDDAREIEHLVKPCKMELLDI